MSRNTGGPAFPEPISTDCTGEKYSISEGMTLRDFIRQPALHAAIAFIAALAIIEYFSKAPQ